MKRDSLSSRSNGASVLVIDDNDIDRATMADLLSEAGFDVHVLPSPIGATRAARQLGVKVVVIDQNLPAMDGTKLAALFHGNPAMRDIRVVLVSSSEDDAMLASAKQAKVDVFLSKRDVHQQLAATVKRLL